MCYKDNVLKFKNLKKEWLEIVSWIEVYYEWKGYKLFSKVYFNEFYIKIMWFDVDEKYFLFGM